MTFTVEVLSIIVALLVYDIIKSLLSYFYGKFQKWATNHALYGTTDFDDAIRKGMLNGK